MQATTTGSLLSDVEETCKLPIRIQQGRTLYEDRNQSISLVTAHFNGFSKEYFVSDHGQRAALLAVRDGEILFVKQYRLLINGISYEIPGGRVAEDETPEAAAMRECLEETGVECTNLKLLISYHPSLDIWQNLTHIFCSHQPKETVDRDSDRYVWISLERCVEMIHVQQIVDSLSILSVLWYVNRSATGTQRFELEDIG